MNDNASRRNTVVTFIMEQEKLIWETYVFPLNVDQHCFPNFTPSNQRSQFSHRTSCQAVETRLLYKAMHYITGFILSSAVHGNNIFFFNQKAVLTKLYLVLKELIYFCAGHKLDIEFHILLTRYFQFFQLRNLLAF